MCNFTVANQVIKVIDDFVREGRTFTAYDVTVEARKRAGERLDNHAVIRNVVHNSYDYDNAGYEKTLIALTVDNNLQAFAFHPIGTDPQLYPLALKDASVVVGTTNSSAPVDPVLTVRSTDKSVCVVTKEDRLNIPKRVYSTVAQTAGSYDVFFDGNLKCVIPNHDGRVRFSVEKKGRKFKVEADAAREAILVSTVG